MNKQLPGSIGQQPNYAKRPFDLLQGTNDERIRALELIIFGPENAEPDYIDPAYTIVADAPQIPQQAMGLLDRLAALEAENERLRSVFGGNG